MLGFLPWRGTLYGKPGGRIPQDFFVGEPDFDKYTAEQRSLGYQFEHAFNDTVTVRQNLRYTHSKVDYRSVSPPASTAPAMAGCRAAIRCCAARST